MKIHHFTKPSTPRGTATPKAPFTMQGLALDDFRKIHGGDFCPLPESWHGCQPGFKPYRMADGTIVGVQDDTP
jgi:hypothetical protein